MPKNTKIVSLASIMFTAAMALVHCPPIHAQPAVQDALYVGDAGDNTVKRFNSQGHMDIFVQHNDGGLHGPRGLFFDASGDLIVSDQGTGTSANGDVLQYGPDGALIKPLVSSGKNSPYAPRGIITANDSLYVANFLGDPQSTNPLPPGQLLKYTANGAFAGAYSPPSSLSLGACGVAPNTTPGEFHPRGLVVGPDQKLYISNYPCLSTGLGGQVLKFDPGTGVFTVFVSDGNDFNRPEGLVFSPDGKLFVTSFRTGPSDTDKILIFQGPSGGTPGAFMDQIDLYKSGDPRVYAQALLFGPSGKLFVPISGGASNATDIGSVRRYDVGSKYFDYFAPAGSLLFPFYLTFGLTNPSTLAYTGQ